MIPVKIDDVNKGFDTLKNKHVMYARKVVILPWG